METKQVYEIDKRGCLYLLPSIEDKSVDMILTDLPYGTTACLWDTVIPFEPLWTQYKRIIKDNGAIVLTASQPFTSALIMSNIDMFRYELLWLKEQGTGNLNANKIPLKQHENIIIFYKKIPIYNPQMMVGKSYQIKRKKNNNEIFGKTGTHDGYLTNNKGERFPTSILYFKRELNERVHNTQKPVALFEYLIKTYTNEGDTVHDSCLGSGTTLEACLNTNRNCIGFEISDEWEDHYRKRLRLDISKLTDTWDTKI